MFTICDFDPFNADNPEWAAYFNFCKTAGSTFPDGVDEFKKWVKSRLKENNNFKLIYRDDALVTAMMSFSKKSVSGGDLFFIDLECIITEQSILAFAKIIAEAILELTSGNPTGSFRISTANPLIREILTLFGGKIINTKNFYQLYRHQLNKGLMEEWGKNEYLEVGELRLVIDEYVPENLYGQYAALLTVLMNDIKREDSQEYFEETVEGAKRKMELFKKRGVKMLTLLLSDLQGRLIGISINLLYPNSLVANQEMTGVIPEYRNKKLASFLKATITAEVFKRFPEIEKMETDCYDANKPMIHINEATGYTLKGKSFQFSVDLEKIERFLQQNKAVEKL